MKRSVLLVIASLVFLLAPLKVFADTTDLIITGNAANSTNTTNFGQHNNTTVQQSNNAQITNDIKAKADTGGNSTIGNTGNSIIQTGDAKVVINVNNKLNTNGSTTNNCCNTSPTLTPTPNSNGSNGPGVTAAASLSNGGTGGGGNSNTGSVLGLSNTAGNETENLLFYFTGLLCLSLGVAMLRAKNLAR